MKKGILFGLLVLFAGLVAFKPDDQVNLKGFKLLRLSEVEAGGWLRNLVERDMTQGYLSAIDKMQPTMKHKVFGPDKVTNFDIDKKGDYTIRKTTWWWGEHEGYFADLVVRSAFITGNPKLIQKADSIVNYVLQHQEEDGYIGIYKKSHRLSMLKGENGELWTQSRILNALISYYEFTGKKEVLDAVEKAAKLTMSHYGPGKSYFQIPGNNGGGTAHGLMFIETMEMLHTLTGDKAYADFAFWLYNDYSTSKITNNRDNQLEKLLDRDLLFEEHGAHIVEHMRAVLWLSTQTNDPRYKTAFDNIFYKLNGSTVPSGALVSDELVKKRPGDPNNYYEFCTMTERVISTFSGMQKSGRADLADEIEDIVFNAAQGARFADMSSTSYLSTDNKLEVKAFHNNHRYQHSANNNPACCNLNAGKLYPYFVSNLWMKTQDEKGLVATAYGPSKVTTTVNGAKVTVEEVTNYPFENQVTFKVQTDRPAEFSIICRKPGWADNMKVKAGGASTSTRDGYYIFTKKWKSGDKVTVSFESSVKPLRAVNGDTYLRKGALLYALPIEEVRDTVKTFRKGFYHFNLFPKDRAAAEKIFSDYKLVVNPKAKDSGLKVIKNRSASTSFPWDVPHHYLLATFEANGEVKTEKLYPMGSTILRKVSFPTNNTAAAKRQ
ncbi:beta-L-arabinofuranosidase domain-containing protein [Botryobacter ruber]|uniref:beta-L-arabinofuranosidase domain-containing protein n=1 Tax=Botryobacter ruber TaxID=2171629 RepID=UPI000E0A8D2A|nr:beta-L-arabinofuranosidase domain-containing protein [Botryobacter ruber]